MPAFNIYQPTVSETRLARKGFIWALAFSVFLHIGLYFFFMSTKLQHFTPYTERLVPRAFTLLGRVTVNESQANDETEKQQQSPAQKAAQDVKNIDLPQDAPTSDSAPAKDLVYTPSATPVNVIANEKPTVSDTNLKALEKTQTSSQDMDADLKSVSEQLLKDKTKTTSTSLLKLSDSTKSGAVGGHGTAGDSDIPGTKSLDDALKGTGGGLQNGDRIGIPGGALFEYDKADLRAEAIENLRKLALIVKRYPGATFSIDGYADSFGSPAYNKDLSQRRADAVKAWLLVNVGVDPFKIEARGLGSTNFVVPPSGTPEEQEKNRRVEIGIKFPR
jgi:outer membrane protein OmpA-like peptidoglycan-associated protein